VTRTQVNDLVESVLALAGKKLPVSFWKLEPMRQRWGAVLGTILHFISYVIVPIIDFRISNAI
jgi:hypothetical protein